MTPESEDGSVPGAAGEGGVNDGAPPNGHLDASAPALPEDHAVPDGLHAMRRGDDSVVSDRMHSIRSVSDVDWPRTPTASKRRSTHLSHDANRSYAPSMSAPELSFSPLPHPTVVFTWRGVQYWVPAPAAVTGRRRFRCFRFGRRQADEAKQPEGNDEEKQASASDETNEEVGGVEPTAPMTEAPPPQLSNNAVDEESGMLALLMNVTGYSQPGRLTALCGSSGAGKSTLLDVLANRKTKGRIEGDIRSNGETVNYERLKHFMGYVEQRDLHISKQTVEEAVLFAARTRLPPDTPDETAREYTEHILTVMNLAPDRKRLVGSDEEANLSGVITSDARKRLSMAVEYAANAALYFLDEPTSGLDARSALRVIRAIRAMANNQRSVVAVIHQPSYEVFSAFDDLLLLRRGGRTVYFGELGDACTIMTDYFARNGADPIDDRSNPADYMLRVIGAGVSGRRPGDIKDWAEIWQQSPEAKAADANLDELVASSQGAEPLEYKPPNQKQQWRRLYYVTRRQLISYWRTPNYNFSRYVLAIALGLMIGLFFLKLPRNNSALDAYVSVLYLSLLYAVFLIQNVLTPTFQERSAFYREVASGTYHPVAYALAIGFAEFPYTIIGSVIYTLLVYFMVGYPATGYGYFLFMNILFSLYSVSLGQLLAALLSSQLVGVMLAGMLIPLQNIFSGFLAPYPEIPHWLWWAYYANPYRWALEGIVVSALTDLPFHCDAGEYGFFPLPPQFHGDCSDGGALPYGNVTSPATCQSAGVRVASGSVACCTYCPVTSGNQIIAKYGLHSNWRWIDIGAMCGFYALYRVATVLTLVYVRHLNR
ncbi:hypothetical protein CDCA_CDCA03G1035 [Cyanidium caldarium]|uniref:Probable ATP-dependent transporter ycf16 n=1 Tax=Cyanidium caldarium TaxID=2771 RepID=A0AAV9IRT1_CYACA|nr:hypothetical protein CDCA_CDCA03G1035 [Cyanidium caldarium]